MQMRQSGAQGLAIKVRLGTEDALRSTIRLSRSISSSSTSRARYRTWWLCCTNPMWDSFHESIVVAGLHEQTYTPDL